MLFRGFIFDRLDQLTGRRAPWAIVVLQGVLFGVAHAYLGPSGAILAGVLGLVLGAVFLLADRNLWPCFLLHGLVDTTSMTAVFLGLTGKH
jgi:membrane protease YdiL (CAAX protease family)